MVQPDTSWESHFERHAPALILFARRWADDVAGAEDAVQEAFLRFWRARGSVRSSLPFLYSCVKRCALEMRRGEARRRRREADSRPADLSERVPFFVTSLEQAERSAMIESALASLPAEQGEVLVLKIWGELTFAEIGEALEIPLNTAASRYRYAIESLRIKLSREARHDVG